MGVLKRIFDSMKNRKFQKCKLNGEDRVDMVYESETRVIYYWNEYGIAPYISENGKYCRFIDNKIQEID